MLGLAGGTAFRVLRHLLPDCRLTAIDIDPEIVGLAREHMDLEALGIEIIIGDAYPWLAQNQRTFDVVIDDIYLAGKTDVFRPRAWDAGLLDRLRRAVAPGGVLAVNLVTGAGHRTMQSLTRRVLRGAFPVVRSLKSAEAMNEVLVAGDFVAPRRRLDGLCRRVCRLARPDVLGPPRGAADFLKIFPMPSPIQELYETRVYPAMSHPLSDPAVSAVAARLGGLAVRHPAAARILEIGCCSGLNLIPLALRWPDSRFVGIDLSGPAIAAARELAARRGWLTSSSTPWTCGTSNLPGAALISSSPTGFSRGCPMR